MRRGGMRVWPPKTGRLEQPLTDLDKESNPKPIGDRICLLIFLNMIRVLS